MDWRLHSLDSPSIHGRWLFAGSQYERGQLKTLLINVWSRTRPPETAPLLVTPGDAAQVLGPLRNAAQGACTADLFIYLFIFHSTAAHAKSSGPAQAVLDELASLASTLPATATQDGLWRRNIGSLIPRKPALRFTGDAAHRRGTIISILSSARWI